MKQLAIYWLAAAIMAVVVTSASMAESLAGNISGKIIDKTTKQPVAAATVRVADTAVGAIADTNGAFCIRGLSENVYRLLISCIGYESFLAADVRVIRGKTTTLEIELPAVELAAGQVTVTAGSFQNDNRAPVSNHGYTREEINRNPGAAGDVFRALEALPGVSSAGGDFSAFSVRGGSPRDNIILVDNIPIDKVSHLEIQQQEQESQGGKFSIFAPNVIDRARLLGGAFPARYGGKTASLIDLRVREGNQESPTVNGSYDLLGWEVNYDGPTRLPGKTSLLLSVRHQDFERVMKMVGEEESGYPRFTDIVAKTMTDIGSSNRLWLLGIYSPERYTRDIANVYAGDDLSHTDLCSMDDDKYLLGVNWRSLPGKSNLLQSTLYAQRHSLHQVDGRAYTDPIDGVVPTQEQAPVRDSIYTLKDIVDMIGAKSELTREFSDGSTLTPGVEINRTFMDYANELHGGDTLYTFDRFDNRPDTSLKYVVVGPEDINARFNAARTNAAVYAEYFRPFSTRITVNVGLRCEYNEFNRRVTVSPRWNGCLAINPQTRVNLAAGIHYQMPELQTLVADAANAALKAEQAGHIVAGLTRYLRKDLQMTSEAYYKYLDNLVVQPDRTSERRTNQGRGWAAGVDLSLIKRLDDNVYGQINYSRAWSKRNDNDGAGWYVADYHQPHVFNILAGYQVNKEWTIAARWKYATGLPKNAYVIYADVHDDPSRLRYSREVVSRNTERLPDFHSLNVRVDYRRQLRRVALVAFIDIMNLYNRQNVSDEQYLPMTGEVDTHAVGITPTIGLKLEL